MKRRGKLPTNGDGEAMVKCDATAASYATRTSEREPTPHEQLAEDVQAGRMTLADAVAEIDRVDPIEGRTWLAFAFRDPDHEAWDYAERA